MHSLLLHDTIIPKTTISMCFLFEGGRKLKKVSILTLLAVLLFVSGCSSSDEGTLEKEQQANMAMEYNLETNDWSPIMIEYGTDEALEAYAFAAEHPEVTDYMPCYCGCHETDGHTNNTACFVDNIDGNIAKLDSMGLG